MKIALALICFGLGAFAGELLTRVAIAHEVAGRLFHRGRLIGLIQGNGIFESMTMFFAQTSNLAPLNKTVVRKRPGRHEINWSQSLGCGSPLEVFAAIQLKWNGISLHCEANSLIQRDLAQRCERAESPRGR